MKRLISILVVLMMTVVAQTPVVTQTAQFTVGPINARFMKVWGEDFLVSKYTTETSPTTIHFEELVLVNKFGEVIWSKNFSPRELGSRKNLIITSSNLFCIFTLGDTVYKINKAGEILKKKFLNSTIVETALQSNGAIIIMEVNMASIPSRFFVYNEELDLINTIVGQPGATLSVSHLRDAYFVAGSKYGGGINTNISSDIARYDTAGNLLWLKQFPDVIEMRSVVNRERVYFCGVDVSSWYSRLIYGEVAQDSGDTLWTKAWGADYPDTLPTLLRVRQMISSPDGGFTAVGVVTAPGQQISAYDQNVPAGLVLGCSPNLNDLWVKTTDELGRIFSGDWKDSSLAVISHLGYPFSIPTVIIYSVSGLTVIEDDEIRPKEFTLGQNYPNPFNPSTKIEFSLIEAGLTSLKVYDLLGREVATLIDEELLAGKYEVSFEASSLASGVYIYTLSVGRHTETRKMLLLR